MTQLLETLSLGEGPGRDALLLRDFARVLVIPMRSGHTLTVAFEGGRPLVVAPFAKLQADWQGTGPATVSGK